MRISYTNLIDAASAPTCLTTDLLYPAANLQNQRLSKRWRSTSPTAQTVVVNLGSAMTVDTVAVLGHNLESSAAITIEAHTSDSWGTPALSAVSLTYNADTILQYWGSAAVFQYWRFTLDDATNTDGYVEAGRLWLGTYLSIDPSSTLAFTVTKQRSDTVAYGRDRQKYATEGVGWREFNLSFPRTNGSALTSIQTMYDTVGNHSSVIFSNFDSLRTYPLVEPVYCSIVGEVAFRHTRYMKFEYGITFEEDR